MKDLLISFFGLTTSLVVVAMLVFMELEWSFAFYSLMHFFIVPTGAIVCGILAAGGYYFGALFLNSRPTPVIMLDMVLVSICTYFMLNYSIYLLLEIDGQPVSSLASFGEYMDIILTSMSMTIGRGDTETGELGTLGYVVAALQILGFAAGGLVAYFLLRSKTFCELCNKYYKTAWENFRFAGDEDADTLTQEIREVAEAFDSAEIETARARHNNIGLAKHTKNTHLRLSLKLENCPECARNLLSLDTSRLNGTDWENINELSFAATYPGKKDEARANDA